MTETSQKAATADVDGEPADARPTLVVLGAVLLVAVMVPPVSTEARRSEAFEALQFALLALAVPALLVAGAPWRWLGLATGTATTGDGNRTTAPGTPRLVDRMAAARRRHREPVRGFAYLACDAVVIVAWRLPPSVDALARHGWVSVGEALLLVGAGIGLWLELIASPPFVPRLGRPQRIAMAAVAMWTVWVAAYVLGLSHSSVYRAYTHVAGDGLSLSADQAVATGILWFVSLGAFVPVIFSNLVIWLGSDEDPDDALFRLIRDGRRRQPS